MALGLRVRACEAKKYVLPNTTLDAFGNAIGNEITTRMEKADQQRKAEKIKPPVTEAYKAERAAVTGRAIDRLDAMLNYNGGLDVSAQQLQPYINVGLENNWAVGAIAADGESAASFKDSYRANRMRVNAPLGAVSAPVGSVDAVENAIPVQQVFITSKRDEIYEVGKFFATSAGVVTGVLQNVGDMTLGIGGLLRDALLAQQYMLLRGESSSWVLGHQSRREAFDKFAGLGSAVARLVSSPKEIIGDAVGRAVDGVQESLDIARASQNMSDWFLYGGRMGNAMMGVANVVLGASAVAKLATGGAARLSAALDARMAAYDVSKSPFIPELSTGAPVPLGKARASDYAQRSANGGYATGGYAEKVYVGKQPSVGPIARTEPPVANMYGSAGPKSINYTGIDTVVPTMPRQLVPLSLSEGSYSAGPRSYSGMTVNGQPVDVSQGAYAQKIASVESSAGANAAAGADKIVGPIHKTLEEMNFAPGTLRFSDSMSDDAYKKLLKNIQANGIKNNVITYVEIEGVDYIAIGNNRYMAAQRMGMLDQLRFEKSDFPVPGTNWDTAKDILDASGNVKMPKVYPKR